MEDNILPSLQLHRAFLLGRAYNHKWAVLLTLADLKRELSIADIRKIVLERVPKPVNPQSDTLTPFVDDEGYILHVTATGRQRWQISPSGEVVLTVHRRHPTDPEKSVEVVRAVVGTGIENIDVIREDLTHQRHILELQKALQALTSAESALVCRYYYDRALPDEEKPAIGV